MGRVFLGLKFQPDHWRKGVEECFELYFGSDGRYSMVSARLDFVFSLILSFRVIVVSDY